MYYNNYIGRINDKILRLKDLKLESKISRENLIMSGVYTLAMSTVYPCIQLFSLKENKIN